ncbi:MAG TPA: helix-turn-helix transcriptional regulator, partial [Vicinamibacterales bacterium]|nr:helix-turn-helix transcriptional regulator [Vicinamibacterales bacterium]
MRRVAPTGPAARGAMLDTHTFGPWLRRERERRGVSLDEIARLTKVSSDLWAAMERNDFSRWPSGIYARAYLREYCRIVGLEPDEIVDEFCRLFPIADRRIERLIRAQAETIGLPSAYEDDRAAMPRQGDRRAGASAERPRGRLSGPLAQRAVAVAVDLSAASLVGGLIVVLAGARPWTALASALAVYYPITYLALGATPGALAAGFLRDRLPA